MKIYYKNVAPIFLILMGLLLLCPQLANAQSNPRNPCYYPTPTSTNCIPTSSTSPLPVTTSVSVGGFTPALTFATLTATGSSASTALPAGTTVFFQNTGTTAVSCTLGVGSATATANEIIVPASSGVPVVVGSNTFGACIDQTGSASNLIVLAGGSGLGNAFGGGSSGSGGSVTQGTTPWVIDTVASGGSGNLINAITAPIPYLIATTCTTNTYTNGSTSPGNANINGNACVFIANTSIAVTGTFFQATQPVSAASLPLPTGAATFASQPVDPCTLATKVNIAFATSSGTVQVIAPSGTTQVYVCSFSVIANAAAVVNLVGGTGATCTTGTPVAAIGSTTAASGLSLAANGGLTFGNGGASVTRTTTAGHGLCIIQSGTVAIAGNLTYVQQ